MRFAELLDYSNPLPAVCNMLTAPRRHDTNWSTLYRGLFGLLSAKSYLYGSVALGINLYDTDIRMAGVSAGCLAVGYGLSYLSHTFDFDNFLSKK